MQINARPRAGNVTAWLAICLPVLVGILALGMDGGRMMEERQRARGAADAAALAGAKAGYDNLVNSPNSNPSSVIQQAALNNAAANGYANDGASSIVTVHVPPQSGAFAGQSGYCEVVLQSNLTGTFGRIFTSADYAVRGRGVARYRRKPLGVVALSATASGAVNVGNQGLTIAKGSVYVDSSSSSAYTVGTAVTAATHSIVGGLQVSGNGSLQGTVQTQVSAFSDPLATLPAPTLASYPVQSSSNLAISSTMTLQPGVYTGGINLSGQAQVNLNPGVYIINGGGFQLSGQASVSGSGVMIYNTGGGALSFTGQGDINLTAPTTGAYAGMAIFQDRAVSTTMQIAGNGAVTIAGQIYAPSATLKIAGNGTLNVGGVIGNTVDISAQGTLNVNVATDPPVAVDLRIVE